MKIELEGISHRVPVTKDFIKVDPDKCNQCAVCARACAVRAISLNPYPVFSSRCMGCCACFNLCPTEAITTSLAGGRGRYRGPALSA